MYSHEPPDYQCPFCKIAQGGEDKFTKQDDVVYRSESVTAFVSPKWWPKNPGHVVVIPNNHVENIYDITDDTISAVYKAVKQVALAMKSEYMCDGVSTRQHNEPSGDQDLWHFHVHVFPRYPKDHLYLNHEKAQFVDTESRAKFAGMLRAYFDNN